MPKRLGGMCRGFGGGRLRASRPAGVGVPFDRQCQAHGLIPPVAEHLFALEAAGRRWRFDWAWIDQRIALEVEGGYAMQARCKCGQAAHCRACGRPVMGGGRHTRAAGFLEDMDKYNTAAILGWRVYRQPTKAIASGGAVRLMAEVFKRAGASEAAGLEALIGSAFGLRGDR